MLFTSALELAAIAYALLGGVFLGFSDFIMRGLAQAGPASGGAGMQGLNRTVLRSGFIVLFFAMVPASLLLGAVALVVDVHKGPVLIAAAIYLLGAFLVTALGNVPLNQKLASVNLGDAEGRQYWTQVYLPRWTFWNSVRTAACILAALILGLRDTITLWIVSV